jgi:hypothetical protein
MSSSGMNFTSEISLYCSDNTAIGQLLLLTVEYAVDLESSSR